MGSQSRNGIGFAGKGQRQIVQPGVQSAARRWRGRRCPGCGAALQFSQRLFHAEVGPIIGAGPGPIAGRRGETDGRGQGVPEICERAAAISGASARPNPSSMVVRRQRARTRPRPSNLGPALRFPGGRSLPRRPRPGQFSGRRTNRHGASRRRPRAGRCASIRPAGVARPVRGGREKRGFRSAKRRGANGRDSPPCRAAARPLRAAARPRAQTAKSPARPGPLPPPGWRTPPGATNRPARRRLRPACRRAASNVPRGASERDSR